MMEMSCNNCEPQSPKVSHAHSAEPKSSVGQSSHHPGHHPQYSTAYFTSACNHCLAFLVMTPYAFVLLFAILWTVSHIHGS